MKIQELHLRNIASIEEADIDFDRDLQDGVTGCPASIFLISGDTGAGKSVILDGISMALYKKTPRTAGVMNTNRNEFSDAEGESIRVGSIEQYTRLGISDRDACYSEVAFMGNDGLAYRVRLTLGMMSGRTDPETGKRPVRHRPPRWEVKVGEQDWTRDQVEQTVLHAVGLTFEQFGRMAMLAQGQFAAFLTGEKKEREAILEQLTNTAHFTAYGKAIKSLCDKAKEAQRSARSVFDADMQHVLPQDEVELLSTECDAMRAEKAALDGQLARCDQDIAQLSILLSGRRAASAAREDIKQLETERSASEYQAKKLLVSSWDATTVQRQRLADLQQAQASLAAAETKEKQLHAYFATLSADLSARQAELAQRAHLRHDADAVEQQVNALAAQRQALEPARVHEELSDLSHRTAALNKLKAWADQMTADQTAVMRIEAEMVSDNANLLLKQKEWTEAESVFARARLRAEEADRRLVTMSTSIDETLTNIRKRLVQEKAAVCPLCGQPIHAIGIEQDFRQMLTPFETEQRATAGERVQAQRLYDEAKRAYDTGAGALHAKQAALEQRKTQMAGRMQQIADDARRLGLDPHAALPPQVTDALSSTASREAELKEKQAQAERLQEKISGLQREKQQLDHALQQYLADEMTLKQVQTSRNRVLQNHALWDTTVQPARSAYADVVSVWSRFQQAVTQVDAVIAQCLQTIAGCQAVLRPYYEDSGKTADDLAFIAARASEIDGARQYVVCLDQAVVEKTAAVAAAEQSVGEALSGLGLTCVEDAPDMEALMAAKTALQHRNDEIVGRLNAVRTRLEQHAQNQQRLAASRAALDKAAERSGQWELLNDYFGGTRFRTLVQTCMLRPLLNNANLYLEKITDRYRLTCSEANEQLAILVHDRYNKDQIRSVTVLSGGERFMVSLALSLALSSLNRPDMNVNMLFIDEGFGTLDPQSLDSVMETLEKLQEIAGQSGRRVGVISHRTELEERIPVQIRVRKRGEGRSRVEIVQGDWF